MNFSCCTCRNKNHTCMVISSDSCRIELRYTKTSVIIEKLILYTPNSPKYVLEKCMFKIDEIPTVDDFINKYGEKLDVKNVIQVHTKKRDNGIFKEYVFIRCDKELFMQKINEFINHYECLQNKSIHYY